jgi:hypothetical protein
LSSKETRPWIGKIKLGLLSLFGQLPRELENAEQIEEGGIRRSLGPASVYRGHSLTCHYSIDYSIKKLLLSVGLIGIDN